MMAIGTTIPMSRNQRLRFRRLLFQRNQELFDKFSLNGVYLYFRNEDVAFRFCLPLGKYRKPSAGD